MTESRVRSMFHIYKLLTHLSPKVVAWFYYIAMHHLSLLWVSVLVAPRPCQHLVLSVFVKLLTNASWHFLVVLIHMSVDRSLSPHAVQLLAHPPGKASRAHALLECGSLPLSLWLLCTMSRSHSPKSHLYSKERCICCDCGQSLLWDYLTSDPSLR